MDLGSGPIWLDWRDYPLLALGLIGTIGIGRLLLGAGNPVRNLVFGLFVIGGISAVFAWVAAAFVIPVVRLLGGLGILAFIWYAVADRRAGGRILPATRSQWLLLALAVVLCLGFQYDLTWRLYEYSGQDLPYFVPFVELTHADYAAPLRAGTYYPAETASTYLIPTTALLGLCAFIPYPTAIHAVEARFIVTSVCMVRIALLFTRPTEGLSRHNLLILGLGFCVLVIFAVEIRTVFIGSTFMCLLLLWEMAAALLKPDEEQTAERALLMAVVMLPALAASKLTIGYVAIATGLFAVWRAPGLVWKPAFLVAATIAFANMLFPLLSPRPFSEVELGFSLVNPFDGRAPLNYYAKFFDGLIDKVSLASLIDADVLVGIVAVALIGFVKSYWIPAWACRQALGQADGVKGVLAQILLFYLLVALFGWLLVRNTQHGLTHQTWLLVLGVGVVWPALQAVAHLHTRTIGVGLIVGVIIYVLPGNIPAWRAPARIAATSHDRFGGTDYATLISAPLTQLQTLRGDEPPGRVGLRSILIGRRLLATDVPITYSGSYAEWIIRPLENAR